MVPFTGATELRVRLRMEESVARNSGVRSRGMVFSSVQGLWESRADFERIRGQVVVDYDDVFTCFRCCAAMSVVRKISISPVRSYEKQDVVEQLKGMDSCVQV